MTIAEHDSCIKHKQQNNNEDQILTKFSEFRKIQISGNLSTRIFIIPITHKRFSFFSSSQILEEGVHSITWKDVRTVDYVQDVMHAVCNEYFTTAQAIQENFTAVQEIVESWRLSTTEITMTDEKSWPFTFEEYDKQQKYNFAVVIIVVVVLGNIF